MTLNNKHYGFKKFSFQFDRNKLYLIIPFIVLFLLLIVIPLLTIFIRSFISVSGYSIGNNFDFIFNDGFIFSKIFTSIFISLIATFFCVLIAYPFTYLLSQVKNNLYRSVIVLVTTAPI
jgi:spermidine/putrescine transport system permease protein